MRKVSFIAAGAVLSLLANIFVITNASAQQTDRLLRPSPPAGTPVIPFMEGWYDNGDGSITLSFGYQNRNKDPVTISVGEDNRIEPEVLGGMQPEVFLPGRHHGVYAVTIPSTMNGATVWWHLSSGGQDLKVPGDRSSSGYELDRNPRPQGSIEPLVGFSESGPHGRGPDGIISERVMEASVNQPVMLEVWTQDLSKRNTSDPRYAKPLDTRVSWYKHQGPGEVEFIAHESMPFLVTREQSPLTRVAEPKYAVAVKEQVGPARINASFSEPGDYLIRVRLDNWIASDSNGLDQCCWSNAFQRVRVSD